MRHVMESRLLQRVKVLAPALMVAAALPVFLDSSAFGFGKPIVSNGTIRTAEGQLLRGHSLHIRKGFSVNSYGLDTTKLKILRDQCHYNTIRLNCLDPRAIVDGRPTNAFTTIAEEAYYTDSVIANCKKLGMYVVLDYHCMGWVYDGSTWDIRNFWDFYAPRYKDQEHVIYEIMNETYGANPPDNTSGTQWPTDQNVDLYKNHVRKYAPNNIVTGFVEPVAIESNWGPYLRDVFAPAAGINWANGKDVWAFHVYGASTASAITQTRAAGVPVFCTEYSYFEDGWYSASLGGARNPPEWFEPNDISWLDWTTWSAMDQEKMGLTVLVPDATAKGYAWWGNTQSVEPSTQPAEAPRVNFTEHAATMIQANGRVVGSVVRPVEGQARPETRFRVIMPGSVQRTR